MLAEPQAFSIRIKHFQIDLVFKAKSIIIVLIQFLTVGDVNANDSETGGVLFREYCFGLNSAANSVSSAKSLVSSFWHKTNKLALYLETRSGQKTR